MTVGFSCDPQILQGRKGHFDTLNGREGCGFPWPVFQVFFPTVSHSVFPSKGQKKMLVEFGVDQDQDRLICPFFILGAPGDSSCKRLGNLTLSTIPGQAQENLQKASEEEKAQC